MSKEFNADLFLEQFTALGTRQGKTEMQARKMIEGLFTVAQIPFKTQPFQTEVPIQVNAQLLADGEKIEAVGTSFMSGQISGKGKILSSMISSQRNLYDANINFNPYSDAISRSNHYFAPSLAIAKKDVQKVLNAKQVIGSVNVEPFRFESANILVGNTVDPTNILIAHYDSIGPGAIDNASGITTLLSLIFQGVDLSRTLFVFSGNEELSFDQPVYWGKGYRAFEKEYRRCLGMARAIYVVDSIGSGSVNIEQNKDITKLAFPIKHIACYEEKVFTVSSNYLDVMETYHSDADTTDSMIKKDIIEAVIKLKGII